MEPIRSLRAQATMSQRELALIAGTSQPTIAQYESGRKSPTWRTVQRLADAAGVYVEVRVHPELTREDRRSIALHRAIAHRLSEAPDKTLTRARTTLKRMRRTHPDAAPLLTEWRVLLQRPLSALLPGLTDPSPYARELRHVTPLAGVLSARERADAYRAFAAANAHDKGGEP